MQATRTHIALVIDEYGGTDGLVSIEDLVEMIVGDIEDEHDETGVAIQPASGGYLMIEARASLEEVGEVLGTDLELHEAAEDVETIGGYLTTIAGRVPSRGELIRTPNGIEFEVMDADPPPHQACQGAEGRLRTACRRRQACCAAHRTPDR